MPSLFFFVFLKLPESHNQNYNFQRDTRTHVYAHTHTHTVPGLSYIGSNHNLSNTRRRSFEHLRRVREKDEIGLDTDIEKGVKLDNRQTHRLSDGHCQRDGQREKQKNADLRLINGWHEGVQRDDNEPVWNTTGHRRKTQTKHTTHNTTILLLVREAAQLCRKYNLVNIENAIFYRNYLFIFGKKSYIAIQYV